ncbi:hypothetical protein HK104_005536 [Borealophlyctis nickersoniae]|nr:hypothetical protein HK104_005536 [Borealophlyctis nickersoniae]
MLSIGKLFVVGAAAFSSISSAAPLQRRETFEYPYGSADVSVVQSQHTEIKGKCDRGACIYDYKVTVGLAVRNKVSEKAAAAAAEYDAASKNIFLNGSARAYPFDDSDTQAGKVKIVWSTDNWKTNTVSDKFDKNEKLWQFRFPIGVPSAHPQKCKLRHRL